MKPKYVVQRCDDGGSLPDQKRNTSWDVCPKGQSDNPVCTYQTRAEARATAAVLNKEAVSK